MTQNKSALTLIREALRTIDSLINEPPPNERLLEVREYRHSIYRKWDVASNDILAALAEIEQGQAVPDKPEPYGWISSDNKFIPFKLGDWGYAIKHQWLDVYRNYQHPPAGAAQEFHPLPSYGVVGQQWGLGYTAEQMRAYAKAAMAAPQLTSEVKQQDGKDARIEGLLNELNAVMNQRDALSATCTELALQSTQPATKEAVPDTWKEAVLDQCAITHMPFHENNPRKTLNEIINWHVAVSLDPAVSSDAEALIERGRQEAQHPASNAQAVIDRRIIDLTVDKCEGVELLNNGRLNFNSCHGLCQSAINVNQKVELSLDGYFIKVVIYRDDTSDNTISKDNKDRL